MKQRLDPGALAAWLIGIGTWGLVASATVIADEPIWDANKVEMRSEKLAEGVFAFYAENPREVNAKGGAAATSGGLIGKGPRQVRPSLADAVTTALAEAVAAPEPGVRILLWGDLQALADRSLRR